MTSASPSPAASAQVTDMASERRSAARWFRELRDEIARAFEALEANHVEGPGADLPPGTFELRETFRRAAHAPAAGSESAVDAVAGGDSGSGGPALDGGGGLMSVMRDGRLFEKVGVNVSEVHGELDPRARAAMTARREIQGIDEDPRFWASGISLVAHMRNPHVPAVHMNTRMFWTPGAWWFGGGADLNPCIEYPEDTAHFHETLRHWIEPHGTEIYPGLKDWADRYFHVAHRGRARGVGGVFMDDRCTGDWERDFALTRDIGRAFLPAFLPLVERRRGQAWSDSDRETQLLHRGLYAEYNLVYDRGTKFGLETGHDADAVLVSMPPVAKWR